MHNRFTYTQIIIRNFLLVFSTVYKNERKQQILTKKISKKATFTIKIKKYLI